MGLRGLLKDLIVATPGLKPPTFWVPVMYLSQKVTGDVVLWDGFSVKWCSLLFRGLTASLFR